MEGEYFLSYPGKNWEERIQKIDEYIKEKMLEHAVEGFSIALVKEGKIVWRQGFGVRNKEEKLPVELETVFEAGSLTKPIASYVALKSVEEGTLILDKPLTDYLPEPYLKNEPLYEKITARHILTHTSGFPNWRPKEEALKVHFEPGERFSYSGEGFMYLQKVLEEIEGTTFETIAQEKVFNPLGLDQTSLTWQEEFEELAARGYTEDGKVIKKWKPEKAVSASSLHISPTNYAKFIIALMQEEKTKPGQLAIKTLEKMLDPAVPVNDAGLNGKHAVPKEKITKNKTVFWGLGWGIEKTKERMNFWHWGANYVYHSYVIGNRKEKWGMVMMGNSFNTAKLWKYFLPQITETEHPSIDWLRTFF